MKSTVKKLVVASAVIISSSVATSANAAVTVNIMQSGTDVVATTTGTLDLGGLTSQGEFESIDDIRGSPGGIDIGNPDLNHEYYADGYSGFTGPADFGSGTRIIYATSSSGNNFAVNASYNYSHIPYVFVPLGYVSGTLISGSSTFANSDLASLGLDVGQYVYTSANDLVTINIGAIGAVPEPATWAMMLLGFGMIGALMRYRRRGAAVADVFTPQSCQNVRLA